MRKIILSTSLPLLIFVNVFGQPADQKNKTFSIGGQYTHEFVLRGDVRVREWELQGDKLKLKDLGMDHYPAVQFLIEKHLKKNNSVSLVYDQYFMRGSATFDRDIAYNGTLINGKTGIDVSPTRYFRASAIYKGALLVRPRFDLKYTAALVLDYITFYLDGEVSTASTRNEVYEGFGRQALPYPVLGVQGIVGLKPLNELKFELSGSYIPRFKSFYSESGHMYLDYRNFQSALSYSRNVSDFELNIGAKLRYMHLFQESEEDTNIISTLTAGPFVGLIYNFR